MKKAHCGSIEFIFQDQPMKNICSILFVILVLNEGAQELESFHRWRKTNQIRLEKFDCVLPEVIYENKIDMWIIM